MKLTYIEIPEIRYQLRKYGWTVQELEACLMIDMKGDVFYVPYSYISDVGADSVVRYCKARFIINRQRNNEK